jgi:DNA helicase II / ATP-dependent DNA helicase PcrA
MTRELLMENDDVRERLQRRWTHILVDEYQDTSRIQMNLVKLLTSGSLFVVGDADQSIYSWRGAHAGSLSDFEVEFRQDFGDVSTVYLMENYRSTSNIVEAAQKVISQSGDSKSGADNMRQNMKPKRGTGPAPRVIACLDDKAEGKLLLVLE